MNTTKVAIFSEIIFVSSTENSNNNQWYQGINMKKYERFTMIYDIGDILVILLMNTITL